MRLAVVLVLALFAAPLVGPVAEAAPSPCQPDVPATSAQGKYIIARPAEAPDAIQAWEETNAVGGLQRAPCTQSGVIRPADTRIETGSPGLGIAQGSLVSDGCSATYAVVMLQTAAPTPQSSGSAWDVFTVSEQDSGLECRDPRVVVWYPNAVGDMFTGLHANYACPDPNGSDTLDITLAAPGVVVGFRHLDDCEGAFIHRELSGRLTGVLVG